MLTGAFQDVLQTGLNPNLYFLPNDLSVELTLTKHDEFTEQWLYETPYMYNGAIAMSVVLGLNILVIMWATITRCVQNRRKREEKIHSSEDINQVLTDVDGNELQ